MRHDMITVYNRLTSSELTDCSLFEDILDSHFLKFKYFYSLITNVNLKKISSIGCEINHSHISLCIIPHEDYFINDIINTINKRKKKDSTSNLFTIELIETDSKLYLDIYLSDYEDEEDYLYAD